MSDPRLEAVAGMVARVGGAACRLAWVATRAAVVGAGAGVLLWWATAGNRVDEWWQGTATSLLVLALCLAPALWLLNVRFALVALVELPTTLGGVATRRAGRLRLSPRTSGSDSGAMSPAPGPARALEAAQAIREAMRDYGDVAGSWGTVAQLLVPSFWLLTAAALVAVPLLVLLALLAAVVAGA